MAAACDDNHLQAYLEGTLTAAEQGQVEGHLDSCLACRQALAVYKQLFWDLEHPAAAEPVPAELGALSDRLMAAWEKAQTAGTAPQAAPRLRTPAWLGASLYWTRLTPGVSEVIDGLGRAGRRLPPLGLAGLKWLVRRGGGRR